MNERLGWDDDPDLPDEDDPDFREEMFQLFGMLGWAPEDLVNSAIRRLYSEWLRSTAGQKPPSRLRLLSGEEMTAQKRPRLHFAVYLLTNRFM